MRPYNENRFNKDKPRGRDRRGSSNRRGGNDKRGGNDRKKIEFHKVKCDGCGQMSEVPFKPTKDKPVYCNDCFKKNDKKGSSSGSSDAALAEINRKLDIIIEALELE